MPHLNSAAHQIAASFERDEYALLSYDRLLPYIKRHQLRHALVHVGYGPDHLIGEETALICGSSGFSDEANWDGIVLTSHVLAGFAFNKPRPAPIPLRGVTAAAETKAPSMTSAGELTVTVDGTDHVQPSFVTGVSLPILEKLAKVPRADQVPADRPLLPAVDGDPTGISGLGDVLIFREPRVDLLQAAVEAIRDTKDPAEARRLAEAVVLWHHNEHLGRGQKDGWWLSPVAPDQLLTVFEWLYHGELTEPAQDGDVLRPRWRTGNTQAGDAARGAGRVLAGALTGGIRGAVRGGLRNEAELKVLGVDIKPLGPGCAFKLVGTKKDHGEMEDLRDLDPEFVQWLFENSRVKEAQILAETLMGELGDDVAPFEALLPGQGEAAMKALYTPPDDDDVRLADRLPKDWAPKPGVVLADGLAERVADAPLTDEEKLGQVKLAGTMLMVSGILNVLWNGMLVLFLIWVCVGVLWIPGIAMGVTEIIAGAKLRKGEVHPKLKLFSTVGLVGSLLSMNLFSGIAGGMARLYINDDDLADTFKGLESGELTMPA